jgi:hypothetical protein
MVEKTIGIGSRSNAGPIETEMMERASTILGPPNYQGPLSSPPGDGPGRPILGPVHV